VYAQLDLKSKDLDLQVSLDGVNFASGQFPPSMSPSTHVGSPPLLSRMKG
jgi:hypothetical protein